MMTFDPAVGSGKWSWCHTLGKK